MSPSFHMDSTRFMKPELDKAYRVEDLNIYHDLAIVFKEHATSFKTKDLISLRSVSKIFAEVVPKIIRWSSIDFAPLCEPRLDYEAQTTIDNHRVEMASVAMLHFGLDPGKFVRWMEGEYTGSGRNVSQVMDTVKGHISDEEHHGGGKIYLLDL